jgi:hypothetical protein
MQPPNVHTNTLLTIQKQAYIIMAFHTSNHTSLLSKQAAIAAIIRVVLMSIQASLESNITINGLLGCNKIRRAASTRNLDLEALSCFLYVRQGYAFEGSCF